jgi:NDP-sugar pyrophosphorylase family protein
MRKEMLPVGPLRKPLLEHAVEHLRSYGMRDVIFVGSEKQGGDVANYFGDGRRFGIRAVHFPDAPRCKGTGHALLWAIQRLGLKGRELLVYYGDVFNSVDLKKLQETHRARGAIATLAVSGCYVLPKGVATVAAGGVVTAFHEKPSWQGPGKIAVGLVYVDSDRLVNFCGGLPATVEQLRCSPHRDIMANIVRALVVKHEAAAYVTDAYWKDIGSFQDYSDLKREALGREPHEGAKSKVRIPPTYTALSIFVSYRISPANQAVVDGVLVPCLRAAGYRVISGSKLDRARGTKGRGGPVERAHQLIDSCDVLLAIATPVGKDRSPSTYVQEEVTYAETRGKDVMLFVERDTRPPEPWKQQFVYTPFRIDKPGELIRDVLERVATSV